MGEVFLNTCPKCRGAVFLDETNEVVCLNCGNRDFHKINLLIKVMNQAKKSLSRKKSRIA